MLDPTIHPTAEPATLPASILSALAVLDSQRERLAALSVIAADAESIVAGTASALRPRCSADVGNFGAWVHIDIRTIDEAAVVRRAIAALGYRLDRNDEYPDHGYFTIEHTKEGVPGRLFLAVQLPIVEGDGATCRYVQTGEKTVPVYELKCEGAAP